MKSLRIFGLCLITVALVSGSSCSRSTKRGPMDKVVTVKNCQPSEDPVEVVIDDNVTWEFAPPGHDYAVHFKKRSPFSTPNPTVTEKNKVKGDFWCSLATNWCYYEYVITKDHGKPCVDPGVHVGDGG